jgi:hypothetical protein
VGAGGGVYDVVIMGGPEGTTLGAMLARSKMLPADPRRLQQGE